MILLFHHDTCRASLSFSFQVPPLSNGERVAGLSTVPTVSTMCRLEQLSFVVDQNSIGTYTGFKDMKNVFGGASLRMDISDCYCKYNVTGYGRLDACNGRRTEP